MGKSDGLFYYSKYSVLIPYKTKDNEKIWEAIERSKREYESRIRKLVDQSIYEIAEMVVPIEYQNQEGRRRNGMSSIVFDDKYGVLLAVKDDDEFAFERAEKQYEENMKDFIKQCIYEIHSENIEAYNKSMKILEVWKKRLNERNCKEND